MFYTAKPEMQPVFDKWRSTGTQLFFGTEEVQNNEKLLSESP